MDKPQATLAHNVALLAHRQPALARALTACGPHPGLTAVTARDGSASLETSGRRIHSAYAPERRAVADIDAAAALVVCIGSGALHWALAALSSDPDRSVMVIEASLPALHSALSVRSFEPQHWERLVLVTEAAQIAPQIGRWYQPALAAGSQVLELDAWIEQSGCIAEFAAMRTALVQALAGAEADAAAFARFGRAWLVNSVYHSFRLPQSAALWRELHLRLRHTAAVVAGAGPSLESAQLDGTLLSTDTALPFIQRSAGARAVCVSLDPQPWTALHLRDATAPLIAEAGSPAARHTTPAALFTTGHPLHSLLLAAGAQLPALPSAATSVTVAAIQIARMLGCTQVSAAGVDGYYPRGATYARGTYHHHLAARQATRVSPGEHRFAAAVYAQAQPVPGGYALPGAAAARQAVGTALETQRRIAELDGPGGDGSRFDPCAFWTDHIDALDAAVQRLEAIDHGSIPQVLAAAGPHAIAQIPFHAAALRSGRSTNFVTSIQICRAFVADVLGRYCS